MQQHHKLRHSSGHRASSGSSGSLGCGCPTGAVARLPVVPLALGLLPSCCISNVMSFQ